MVDDAQGVWKAPANVSLNNVVPAVNITHREQADLNVDVHGKSINATRSFIDQGTLVGGRAHWLAIAWIGATSTCGAR